MENPLALPIWIAIGLVLLALLFWLFLRKFVETAGAELAKKLFGKKSNPLTPPAVQPPPGARKVTTRTSIDPTGAVTSVTTIDYVDGLPTTPNPQKRQFFEQARKLRAESKYAEAIKVFQQLLGLKPAPSEEVALLIQIGNCFRNLSELEEAQGHYKKAEGKAREADDKEGLAAALGNLGIVYGQRGELHMALEHHQKALEIHTEVGNRQGMASDLGNLGIVYGQRGDLDKALEHLQKALEIDKQIGNRLGMARQLGNMGNVYRQKGDLDRALEHHQKALEIDRQIGNPLGIATDLGSLGLVYMVRGDLDKALEHFQKALEIFEKVGARAEIEKVRKLIEVVEKARAGKGGGGRG